MPLNSWDIGFYRILGVIGEFPVFKTVKDMNELTQATEPAV